MLNSVSFKAIPPAHCYLVIDWKGSCLSLEAAPTVIKHQPDGVLWGQWTDSSLSAASVYFMMCRHREPQDTQAFPL